MGKNVKRREAIEVRGTGTERLDGRVTVPVPSICCEPDLQSVSTAPVEMERQRSLRDSLPTH